MINYIKSTFRVGDGIRISGREGQFEGVVKHIGTDFVVLSYPNGAIQGIHISAIQTFATPNAPLATYPQSYPQYLAAQSAAEGEDETTKVEDETEKDDESEPEFREFKPGDKIPLSELQQRDPHLAKQWKYAEQKKKMREVAPVILEKLKQTLTQIKEENRPEDYKVLEPQGKIIEFQPSFNFAFIDDSNDGARCFFNKSDIVDDTLRNEPGANIPVLYSRSKNLKGEAAKSVHRVMSVMELLELSVELFENGDNYRAAQVLYNAQKQCDNQSIATIISIMKEGRNKDNNNKEAFGTRRDEGIERAKEAKLSKDYELAIDLYRDALERGVCTELCIKEIMQTYLSLHNHQSDEEAKSRIKEEAIQFIQQYRQNLPHNASAMSVLENVYFALGQYEDHVEVTEDLITLFGRNGDLSQYVFYLNKVSLSYMYLNDLERAYDACQQGLEVEPGNPHLLKTLQTITEQPGYTESQSYE